jgi:uncharacterized protein
MAKEGRTGGGGLDAIVAAANVAVAQASAGAPIERWNPPYCGEIDMRIAGDGTWYYQKTPIGRPALVKLFASVLKREDERYFLVTPVEKCGIVVDDAPFVAVELRVDRIAAGPLLWFRTNVDDWVDCGSVHRLRFEVEPGSGGLRPYVHIRRDLWAKVTRALYYDLVELGEEREVDGIEMFGICSQGEFFPMAAADLVKDMS